MISFHLFIVLSKFKCTQTTYHKLFVEIQNTTSWGYTCMLPLNSCSIKSCLTSEDCYNLAIEWYWTFVGKHELVALSNYFSMSFEFQLIETLL